MTDLRKDKRAPASLKVKYKSATVQEFAEQFGTDVSRGGIFVKTKKPIENGAVLKLELQLSDASKVIHGIGRVCWRREPGPDPTLPAGMGIKFIKLDPESRSIVDRIVQGRGDGPSRFDQTHGAEIAQASQPPPSGSPSPFPTPSPNLSSPQARPGAPLGMPSVRGPAASAAEAASRPPAPRAATAPGASTSRLAAPPTAVSLPAAPTPRAAPPKAPAPRADLPPPAASVLRAALPNTSGAYSASRSGAGSATVAGLFANSGITHNPPREPSAESSTRSSFFPPAPGASASGSVGSGRLVPPPASAGARHGGATGLRSSGRADQARQSGQFLAAAFAEGGVAEETATQARAVADSSEDALIDELFAGVVDEPVRPRVVGVGSASAQIEPGSVDDVFAELSEEEGLGEPASDRRVLPARASLPSVVTASRTTSPGLAPPVREKVPAPRSASRASQPDSVDALFAELDEHDNAGASTPGMHIAGSSFQSEPAQHTAAADSLGGSDRDGFGEADLLAASSGAPPGLPLRDSDMAGAPQASVPSPLDAPQRSAASPLRWIVPLLLLAGGAAGIFYYQSAMTQNRAVAPAPKAVPTRAAPPSQAASGSNTPAAVKGSPDLKGQPVAPAGQGEKPAQAAANKPNPLAPVTNVVETLELEVSSLPRDSDINVEGKHVGTTPKHVPLPIGRESHVTVSAAGFAAMTKTVTMSPTTEPLRFRLEPLPYTLVVRTTPQQAELTVGTHTVTSPAPLELGHLDGGVQVSVAKEGYQRMTRSVRVDEFAEKDGVMRAEIAVTLSPLPPGWQAVSARQRKRAHSKPEPSGSDNAPPAPSAPTVPGQPSEATPKGAVSEEPSDALKAPSPAANDNKPAPEGPAPQAAPPTVP